ncbi:ABC transporter substrate-binding protein [Agromyces atrinae]|uniref:Peptide ABC transporter substrate-binding protein n=1 Tax=Agromyces atrinae TaxID=592376 RepID=A0A4Q2MBI8_9MICO|nr:ABC transporter substrate-binding protein [Agromyces atrinae]NYD66722.1 peptide/nickel transport system substrate-binding protein [Agromyces atrinae]RXZ87382.1 peptide ABC transporter substrate-binding protein [Agromyces atrinae]
MRITARLATAAALIAAGALALTGCSAGGTTPASTSAASGGTLTLGAALDASSWDPADAEFGNRLQYMQPVYDSLLHITADLEIEPWLASAYEYDESLTTLTLTLRDDVVFTDGEAFTADVAKANLEHFAAGTGQNSITLAAVSSIEAPSPTELVLTLSAPDPALLRNLALVSGMQASPAALEGGDLKTTPVGSGPYELDADATVVGSTYTYTRNPEYWNPDAFPYDSIVITPLTDLTARLNALKSGQIDAAIADAKSMKEAEVSGLTVNTMEGDWQGLFIVDRAGTKVPALADARVRQALNLAVDGDAILKNVRLGQGSPTTQIFNPTSTAYDEALDDAYPYDPEKAKELLAEAGYPDGFSLTMPAITGFEDLTTLVSQQLGEVGITVETQPVTPDQVISSLLSGEFPVFIFSWGSSNSWQDILKLVQPTAPWNMYANETPELDALILAAQQSTPEDAEDAFRAVSEYLVDEAWFAPWYVQNNIYLSSADTTVTMQPQNVVPYIWNYAPAS